METFIKEYVRTHPHAKDRLNELKENYEFKQCFEALWWVDVQDSRLLSTSNVTTHRDMFLDFVVNQCF